MKTITFIILTVFFSVALNANTYTKSDRILDMQKMAVAMGTIQDGFFYNNFETVKSGISSLIETIDNVKIPIEEKAEKDFMASYMNQKIVMTRKIVKKIDRKSLILLERFKEGDISQAIQAYDKIISECLKCHREVRNW